MARLTRFLPALVSVAALGLPAWAADTGMLYVKSNPPGATVVIAGKEYGKTPVLVRDHPAGDFTLELRIPGAEPVRKQVTVKANRAVTIDVKIQLPGATLTVISEPLEATVLLDGREVGKTPLTLENLDPGKHRLTLLKRGCPRTPRSVVLEPGGKQVLEVKLGSPPAAPKQAQGIPSVPEGAIAIVIKTDGTRLEGEVTGLAGAVVVRTNSGSERVPRGEVRAILNTAVCLDRFKADPNVKDLMVLASRAGVPMPLRRAELSVTLLKTNATIKQAETRGKYPDVLAAAEELLDKYRLTPEHTRKVIDANRAAFKRRLGDRATEYESEHYWVLTTNGEAHAREVAARMDGIFREYQRRLVFKERITEKFVVKVYASESEYKAHGAPTYSMAYFSPRRRELVAYKRPSLYRSLYHEGMHQFLHFYVPDPPKWFDEGLATYFETAKFIPGVSKAGALQYRVGLKDPTSAWHIRRAATGGELLPLRRLTGMSSAEWHGADDERTGLLYGQSWALTHFMIEGNSPLLKRLWKDYFFALRDGATQKEANKKVFGRLNFQMLDNLFKRYVMKL